MQRRGRPRLYFATVEGNVVQVLDLIEVVLMRSCHMNQPSMKQSRLTPKLFAPLGNEVDSCGREHSLNRIRRRRLSSPFCEIELSPLCNSSISRWMYFLSDTSQARASSVSRGVTSPTWTTAQVSTNAIIFCLVWCPGFFVHVCLPNGLAYQAQGTRYCPRPSCCIEDTARKSPTLASVPTPPPHKTSLPLSPLYHDANKCVQISSSR